MPAYLAGMTLDPRKLLFRPRGRLSRAEFVVGVVMFVAVVLASFYLMHLLNPATAAGFWAGLVLLFVIPFMFYSVWGQRLHDMGRSVWPVTAALFLAFLILIGVMLAYGGTEYFSEFSQYDRKDEIDTEVRELLQAEFQAKLANGGEQRAGLLLNLLFGALTVWLAVAPGERSENRYGPPPTSAIAV